MMPDVPKIGTTPPGEIDGATACPVSRLAVRALRKDRWTASSRAIASRTSLRNGTVELAETRAARILAIASGTRRVPVVMVDAEAPVAMATAEPPTAA
jgi:hypothetical protein